MAENNLMSISDDAIQYTNTDASTFKCYAAQKGYWNDPFIKYFAKPNITNKAPKMNRGYFARVHAIKNVLYKFLNQTNLQCQIINIGAGFDTLYFNLFSDQDRKLPLKYIEIDFLQICKHKKHIIKSKKQLFDCLPGILTNEQQPVDDLHCENYHLISVDLRNVEQLDKKLNDCKIDKNIPTLVISECVLIYMKSQHSNDLIGYFGRNFNNCFFLNYEQYKLNDRFGKIMIENMHMRSVDLVGMDSCMSEETQNNRFIKNNFKIVKLISMTDYYKEFINLNERKRIEAIEFLDEVELLYQLLDHYCIGLASNNENERILLNNLI
jgi:[phosphatase 2A protein]-leucine-carboxy methyltransferase